MAGSVGTLQIWATVRELDISDRVSSADSNALRNTMMERFWAINQKDVARGVAGARPEMPEIQSVELGGNYWKRYPIKDNDDEPAYAILLEPEHYIELNFRYLDNSRRHKTGWRQRAENDELSIIKSARIEKIDSNKK